MHNNKYHFVLVHGDCHGAWCWYKVATLLRRASHKATALDMGGCGRADPIQETGSISDYFKPLMLFLEALPMEERVILVGHSRGGIDISIAMERFHKKISAAVFVNASMPGPNLDVSTVCKEFDRRSDSPMDNEYTFGNGEDKPPTSFLFGPKFLASKLYQLSPPEDLTLATFLIRPSHLYPDFDHPTQETVLTKENYGSIPRICIVSDQDKVMKDMQRWLIDNNPPDEVKVISGSDHSVMMSKPRDLCSCLLEIGAKYC